MLEVKLRLIKSFLLPAPEWYMLKLALVHQKLLFRSITLCSVDLKILAMRRHVDGKD